MKGPGWVKKEDGINKGAYREEIYSEVKALGHNPDMW